MLLRRLVRYNYSKVCSSVSEALEGMKDGHFLMVGGFGICGIPMNLIKGVEDLGVKNLTVASNDGGVSDEHYEHGWGLQFLLKSGQIKRMISSYLGWNHHFAHLYLGGQLELEFCPQGTLAERIRAGGAGIPAFYTHTGVDTMVQKGGIPIKFYPNTSLPQIVSEPKEVKIIDGKKFILQYSFKADFSLVKAWKADHYGNLIFNQSARNFNDDMCTAGKVVVAQVDQIVQNGQISPNQVHIPGVYVDKIIKSDPKSPYSEKRIQKLKLSGEEAGNDKGDQIRLKIMRRAAKQVRNGMNINLGIGIPTLLPQALPEGVKINVHSENGVLGVGPYPKRGKEDPDCINAGKETITVLPGGSFFSSSRSFDIIRGGHLHITMLGAMQVSQEGDISNWMVPGKLVKGMGGAMDLVASGSRVIVVMQHMAKGTKKLLPKCTLPLTAKGKASMVITEKAVFENRDGRLVLTDIAEGITLEELQECTGFQILKVDNLNTF